MRLQKPVVTDKPLEKVFGYLSDFTHPTDWDPGTVATVRQQGPSTSTGPGRSVAELLMPSGWASLAGEVEQVHSGSMVPTWRPTSTRHGRPGPHCTSGGRATRASTGEHLDVARYRG